MDHPTQRLDDSEEAQSQERAVTRRFDDPRPARGQPKPDTCPKCGNDMIWTYAVSEIPMQFATGTVYLEQVNGSILRGPRRTQVSALMCTECGYTELYANRPQKLLER